MARRPAAPDPELAALASARLARVLRTATPPRRAAAPVDEEEEGGPTGRAAVVEAAVVGAAVGGGAVSEVVEDRDDAGVGLDDLEPARRFTRWHLGVVAAVLLVGLVWGGWSWVRARPEAVAAPTAVETASVPGGSAASPGAPSPGAPPSGGQSSSASSPGGRASDAAAPAAELVVHVLGAVRRPGVVHLSAGARVQDAIKAAGGLRGDADPDELNLAQPLADGVQVVVGTSSHPEGEVRSVGGPVDGSASGSGSSTGGSSTAGSGTGAEVGIVDLNSASVDQLDALPGVGPVTAQKILDWREQHGRFNRAEELQEVDGIGPKTYARIAPHVRV